MMKSRGTLTLANLGGFGIAFALAAAAHAGGLLEDPPLDIVRHDAGTPTTAPQVADLRSADVWLRPLSSESLPPIVSLEPGKFIVLTVEEGADVRHPGGDWEQLRPGDVIGEGDEFSTGLGRVLFSDHNGNVVSLEPLTTAKITEAKVGVVDHVEINLDYGTLEVEVMKSGVKTDLKVSTPSASSGIRGSLVRMTHDDVSRRSTVLVAEGTATIDTRAG